MSDQQPPPPYPQQYPPQQPPQPPQQQQPYPQPPYQPPQPPYQPPAGPVPPGQPRPKRTGLIITIVVIVVLLLCCCATAGTLLILSASRNTSTSSGTPASSTPTDPKETKRLADWQAAKDAFPLTGYATVAPDARQRKLGEAAVAAIFPDFALDTLLVHTGSYDAKTKRFVFDEYLVLIHLKSDPTGVLARSFAVTQPAADSLARGDIDVDTDQALQRIGGTSWLLYHTDTAPPLMGGIKDQKFAALVVKACKDWPGGVVARLTAASDGTAKVRVFTWDSYAKSNADDYVDVVYAEKNGVWTVQSYDIVTGTGETTPAPPAI